MPNNPEEKNPVKLSYVNPRIDAFPFILDSYVKLYRYVFELTHILTSYTYNVGTETVPILFKSPLKLGAKRTIEGHPKPDMDNLMRYLVADQMEIKKKLDAELPRNEIKPTLTVRGVRK